MAEQLVERHRSLMSDSDDVVRKCKKKYFRVWRFNLAKTRNVRLMIKVRRRGDEALRSRQAAEIRASGIKQDVEEILGEWEKEAYVLRHEFSEGKAAVQWYLDSMQFPFQSNGKEMPASEDLTLQYDTVRKGYEFQRAEERASDIFHQTSIADTGSVSWQTAYDEDPPTNFPPNIA